MSAHPEPPRQRKGPARHTPGPSNSKTVTEVVFTPSTSLLTMADRLIDDGIGWTPVRAKTFAAVVADRLRRRLPVSAEEAAVLQQLYHQRRAELDTAATWFAGCS